MKNNKPQILLLGNGINRTFGGCSWDKFLEQIDIRKDKAELKCPEPMKAILVTENAVDVQIKAHKDIFFSGDNVEMSEEQRSILLKLLTIGFDEILTTNYNYKLEIAALGTVTESAIKKLQTHTKAVERCEAKNMLHTYNHIEKDNINANIWHIHGEARKPDSMILGHYYYSELIGKMLEVNKKRNANYYKNALKSTLTIDDWTDAFIYGDVYILG
ncbi:MAG: SIR2 family protein, partial [Ruminiclostridium sp.]|nr:SIR2 family protein [Ruminiclostridium sp.]